MKRNLLTLLGFILLATQAQASWVSSYLEWTNLALGSNQVQRGYYVRDIPYSENLLELRQNYGNIGLKKIYKRMSNKDIELNNENLLTLIKQNIDFDHNPNGYSPLGDSLRYLNKRQVRVIFDAMSEANVVKNQRSYGGRGVGFCFGRALVAHNHALIRNVHPASIRKIWVVGNMGFWGHHVATIVKSKNSWVAIDDFTGIMTVENWIDRMKFEQKGSKKLAFFITRAERFGHATNSLYNSVDLFNVRENNLSRYESDDAKRRLKSRDFYQGFFMDFYEALEYEAMFVDTFSESQAQVQREEQARIAAIKKAEMEEYRNAKRAPNYDVTQETIYCFNNKNPKLNCNYQLSDEEGIFETSVTITGNAQYLVQYQEEATIFTKHIIREDLTEKSYQIVQTKDGALSKNVVKFIKPQYAMVRPYIKVTSKSAQTQLSLEAEVMQIKDVLAKFNTDYQVRAENASPLVRILNN